MFMYTKIRLSVQAYKEDNIYTLKFFFLFIHPSLQQNSSLGRRDDPGSCH